MFYRVFLILFLLAGKVAYSQDSSSSQVLIYIKIKALEDRATIQSKLLQEASDRAMLYERENSRLKIALISNGASFDGISAYLTLLAIVLTIVLAAAPLLVFFFDWKPGRRAIAKMENLEKSVPKKIADKFGIHYEEIELNKFKEAIRNLSDTNLYIQSLLFLNHNIHRATDLKIKN